MQPHEVHDWCVQNGYLLVAVPRSRMCPPEQSDMRACIMRRANIAVTALQLGSELLALRNAWYDADFDIRYRYGDAYDAYIASLEDDDTPAARYIRGEVPAAIRAAGLLCERIGDDSPDGSLCGVSDDDA